MLLGNWLAGLSKLTVANAVILSLETWAAPGAAYGLTTPVTCGIAAARVSSGTIAARTAGESIVPCET